MKPRVLFVVPDRSDSYHVTVVGDILRRRILSAGYRFCQLTVTRGADGEYDLTQLRRLLKIRGVMAVEMFGVPAISRAVVASGVESIVVVRGSVGEYKGAKVVRFSPDSALAAFAKDCREAGIRHVLQVGFEYGISDASSALDKEGVSVESVFVRAPNAETGLIESVKRATLDYFGKFLARQAKMPDLIYFMDDHAAESGFLSFAVHGKKVPRDVKVVSWSNRGLAPVYVKDVARIEVDPFANGEALARYVMAVIDGENSAKPPVLAARYVRGETFPARKMSSKTTKGKIKKGVKQDGNSNMQDA